MHLNSYRKIYLLEDGHTIKYPKRWSRGIVLIYIRKNTTNLHLQLLEPSPINKKQSILSIAKARR
jgi:hypothetical protein